MNFFFIFCVLFSLSCTLYAQEEYATTGKKMTVAEYLEASEKKKKEGDYKEASRFMNGAATWHWERKEYTKAIEYFQQSIQLNQVINNQQGIIGIKNNLGMLYADLRHYELAYQNFTLVLEERKREKEPISIIASLINISVICNNLKEYDKSIAYLNEAAELALRMGDAEQLRSCYGMLAETYEKKGDVKNMLTYFELYKTFHEKTQKDKLKTVESAAEDAKLRAKVLELENQLKDSYLLQKDEIIAEQEKEVQGLTEAQQILLRTMSKRKLLLKIAENDLHIKELQLHKQKITNELQTNRQQTIRTVLVVILAFLVLIAWLLWQKNREKSKTNRLLKTREMQLMEQAEELLQQAAEIQAQNEKLTALNTIKDKFLSIIAHDVRSPLGVVGNFLELWETGAFSLEETKSLLGQLKTSTFNTIVMLDTMLIWAKSQMKGMVTKPITIVVAEVVENKLRLVNELAKAKNITCISIIRPDTKVYADANQLDVIFHNLFTNAIKFTPIDGFISIDDVTKGQFIEIRISDTGVGMSEQRLAQLFHADSHFSTSGTANEKGTGLGLLVCKEFIEENGGTLQVTSKLGQGSTFAFTLPAAVT